MVGVDKPLMARVFAVYDVNGDNKLDANELYNFIADFVAVLDEQFDPSFVQDFLQGQTHINVDEFIERYTRIFGSDADHHDDEPGHVVNEPGQVANEAGDLDEGAEVVPHRARRQPRP
eukprot:TRINITY_DN244_c0_g3_i2.p1 TRINITY_DN244_c0_g3~~TRINITY_DN244_c0_g3_i2.p1  ORF type:complete len:118 (+),score=22.22 TRINITY_DN244_c0_g3_i2:218-571(+)